MKPQGVTRVLRKAIQAHKPVLLTGAPGVGKTSLTKEAAEAESFDLVVTHPVVEDPTDAKGLAWVAEDKKSAVFLPFGQLNKLLNATRPTVWLIDDIGQASPATQAANMQWLLAREVNGHRLPDCVSIIGATNRKQDRAGVQGLLEPVKSRFTTILDVEADLDQWCTWAFKHRLPPIVIAFLRLKKDYLHKFEPSSDMTNSPSPRTWANLAEAYTWGLDAADAPDVYAGAVGKAYANEFIAFEKLFKEVPNPDAVLLNPGSVKIPDQPDILWALSTSLLSRVNPSNFGRYAEFANRLLDEEKGEFAAVMMRGALNECPDVQHSFDFTRIAATNPELLFAEV